MADGPIYLDFAATTPVDPRVAARMIPFLTEVFGNPASRSHSFGWAAEKAVEAARDQVADLIGADAREIVWTSGATESNNLAIKGAAQFHRGRGNHLVTVRTEHKSVLDTMRELERDGFEVTVLDVGSDGLLDAGAFEGGVAPHHDARLGHVGEQRDRRDPGHRALGELCRERGVLFHVDAAQATGKIQIDLQAWPVDLMSLSAHKTYGPKGIGALYVRRKPRVRIEAQMHGGGHERGMRSGTLPTHQIVGMGEAFRIAGLEMKSDNERIRALRDRLLGRPVAHRRGLRERRCDRRVPHNLNVSFNFVEGESLIMAMKDIAVSSGSACTSASLEPSYVLRALGRSDELAHSSIRFTVGRFTTQEQIDYAIAHVARTVGRLRALSPLWDMHRDGVDLSTVQWSAH